MFLFLYTRLGAARPTQCGDPKVQWLRGHLSMAFRGLLLAFFRIFSLRFKRYITWLTVVNLTCERLWFENWDILWLFLLMLQEQRNTDGKQINYQCRCSFLEVIIFLSSVLAWFHCMVLTIDSLFLKVYDDKIGDLLDPTQRDLEVGLLFSSSDSASISIFSLPHL